MRSVCDQLQPQQTQVELFRILTLKGQFHEISLRPAPATADTGGTLRILTLKGQFHEISLRSAPATADTGGTIPDPDIKRTVS
jgi:hypothetical protein